MIQLGQRLKDKVTGFEGIASGKAEYLTGCTQWSLQPKVKEDGSFIEGRWFDEGRLVILDEHGIVQSDILADKNGCDFSAPVK